jgi:glycosyltransferase involved in cell wall biosynthesis
VIEGVRFAIVSPVWNSEAWVARSIESVRQQTYRNFRQVVIDDVSTDGTFAAAQAAATGDPNIEVIRNEERRFPLGNLVKATALAGQAPDDVVIVVDGDDWLAHPRVLEHMAKIYVDSEVWLTYGSHRFLRRPLMDRLLRRKHVRTGAYPESTARLNLYRYNPGPFLAGHLRTYRKFLWDAIRDEDLRDDDGRYWPAAGDAASMFPMMEMATQRHIRFVPQVLYVYNNNHLLSENRPPPGTVHTDRPQFQCALKIRARPRYAPLVR